MIIKNIITLILCCFINCYNAQKSLKCDNYEFFKEKNKSVWQKIRYKNVELKQINKGNNFFLIPDCNSVNISSDTKFLMVRQIISDKIPKDSLEYLSTYDAPYIIINSDSDLFSPDFVAVENKKLIFFSNSQGIGEFMNNHNLFYKNNTYYNIDDFLQRIPDFIKKKKVILEINSLKELISNDPITDKNLSQYHKIASLLYAKESIIILKKIIEKYPSNIVTWLNLADAQWELNQKEGAKISYRKYLFLIKEQKNDFKKIPKRVYERNK